MKKILLPLLSASALFSTSLLAEKGELSHTCSQCGHVEKVDLKKSIDRLIELLENFDSSDDSSEGANPQSLADYDVKPKWYMLKDGSYLQLGFNIVVEADELDTLRTIIEVQSPGLLPEELTMMIGGIKNRDQLMGSSFKREAFARKLQEVIQEKVLGPYNKKQASSKDVIKVKEILLTTFVTQSG
jgi:hypothetical protein